MDTLIQQEDRTFQMFPKIPRWNREVIVTEKIDGTNAHVLIDEDGAIHAASRKRYISLENDNFGFAKWVEDYKEDLIKLGPGRHYGEWWGSGIQRGYGIKERHFSLFNVSQWNDPEVRPMCCDVVPILWRGLMSELDVELIMRKLLEHGSFASPGFMKPEGIVIFHTASNHLYKVTFEHDSTGKGEE